MPKKISQTRTGSRQVNWKQNLQPWMDGKQNLMPHLFWTDLELRQSFTTIWWASWPVHRRSKSFLHRHFLVIRIFFFWMSLPTTWIWMRSHGWKNSWSTLTIPLLLFHMTVISWIRSAHRLPISITVRSSSTPVITTSGTNPASCWSVRWKKPTRKKKKRSRSYRTLSHGSAPMRPSPVRQLPVSAPWKRSSLMRSAHPAVNTLTSISNRTARSVMKFWWSKAYPKPSTGKKSWTIFPSHWTGTTKLHLSVEMNLPKLFSSRSWSEKWSRMKVLINGESPLHRHIFRKTVEKNLTMTIPS